MRVVLDTNILASAIRAGRGPIADIREAWLSGLFHLHISKPILDELERTLANPYFSSRLSREQVGLFVMSLRATSVVHPIPLFVPRVASHREDDFILATAKEALADFLITGDKRLQALQHHRKTRILPAQPFSDCLHEIAENDDRLRVADRETSERGVSVEEIIMEIQLAKLRTIESYKSSKGLQ